MTDVRIIPQGTLIGFMPVSEAAKQWFEHNVQSDDWQWLGSVLWVEHRPAEELAIELMVSAGFDVRVDR